MKKGERTELKIGTLNLNGETWNLNNKRPRLPKTLFDPVYIKEKLTNKTAEGLSRLLETGEYDIIAVQELVNKAGKDKEFYKKIETVINDKRYRLIIPSNLENEHFTVAFIIKDEYKDGTHYHSLGQGTTLYQNECNRLLAMCFNIYGLEFTIVNVHLPDHKIKNKDNKEIDMYDILQEINQEIVNDKKQQKIILLGDFNAYTPEQHQKGKKAPYQKYIDIFLEKCDRYIECGDDRSYSYYAYGMSNGRKLDHIFISNNMKDYLVSYNKKNKKEKDDTVNFYVDEEFGFTDHSMLTLYLEF